MAVHEHPLWSSFLGTSWFNLVAKHAPGGIGVVDHQDEAIPLILLPLPNRTIYPISNNTHCTVVFDLINAAPYPVPVFFIMAVVFNHDKDPLWSIRTIPVTHLQADENDPETVMRCANLQKINRRAPLAFCNDRKECALVIVNHAGQPVFRNIVSLITPQHIANEDSERIPEIKNALNFLLVHKNPKGFYTFEAASVKIHTEYAVMITNSGGEGTMVPRNRDIIKARSDIFSLIFDSGRLVRREHVAQRNDGEFGKVKYDVFISHAHVDNAHASQLAQQLRTLWPSLRVFITDPKDSTRFENDPMYFLTASRQSKTIVFIATPNSLKRPMTHMEIGLNADKPIVSLFFGWPDRKTLDDWLGDNIYIAVPGHNIFSGTDTEEVRQFILKLASILGPNFSGRLPDFSAIGNDVREIKTDFDPTELYTADFQRIYKFVQNKQTPEEVEALMENFFATYKFDNERDRAMVMGFPPHVKLCVMLEAVGEDDRRLMLLRMFPSLVDEQLLRTLYFFEIEKLKEKNSNSAWIKPLTSFIAKLIKEKK